VPLSSAFRSPGGEVSAAMHLAKPESLFYFGDIGQERKKKKTLVPWAELEKRAFVWQEQAGAVESCSPRPSWSAARRDSGIAIQKPPRTQSSGLSSVRWPRGDVCRCFVFPQSTRAVGGSKRLSRLAVQFCGAAAYFLSVNRSAAVLFVFARFWGKGKREIRLHLSEIHG